MLIWTIQITDLISLSNSKSVLVRKEIMSRAIQNDKAIVTTGDKTEKMSETPSLSKICIV